MSSPIRRMTIRTMKEAGMFRDRRRVTDDGKPNPTFGKIVDTDDQLVGAHWPQAIPKRYVM